MSEIQHLFLSLEDVLELHVMQLDRYGGATGIRDSGLLESAVMMPQESFGGEYVHKSIYEMAAAYAFHIAENQPFVDGNKRTALAAALVFLDWHETEINDSDEKLYTAMIGLAEKKIDKAGLAKLFEKLAKQPLSPVHPWRVCPYGEHWVRTHPLHVPPSKAHPDGSITTRHAHCAHNPSGKDQLYPEEIQEIATQHFSDLKNKPCPIDLGYRNKGNKYDDPIAGWVQYWNEVLKPDESLDPNLVKALVASESRFEPTLLANKKDPNSARGLTQITNETRKILDGFHGDIKDHLITVTKEELNDPIVNICAGVRWLFEKRRLASFHLKRTASWIETVWEYKDVKDAKTKKDADKIKKIFNDFYEKLQKCHKK